MCVCVCVCVCACVYESVQFCCPKLKQFPRTSFTSLLFSLSLSLSPSLSHTYALPLKPTLYIICSSYPALCVCLWLCVCVCVLALRTPDGNWPGAQAAPVGPARLPPVRTQTQIPSASPLPVAGYNTPSPLLPPSSPLLPPSSPPPPPWSNGDVIIVFPWAAIAHMEGGGGGRRKFFRRPLEIDNIVPRKKQLMEAFQTKQRWHNWQSKPS